MSLWLLIKQLHAADNLEAVSTRWCEAVSLTFISFLAVNLNRLSSIYIVPI